MSLLYLLLLPFTLTYAIVRWVTYFMLILYLSFSLLQTVYGIIALMGSVVHFGAWDGERGFFWVGAEGYDDLKEKERKIGKQAGEKANKERRKAKDDIWIGAKRPVRADGRRLFL